MNNHRWSLELLRTLGEKAWTVEREHGREGLFEVLLAQTGGADINSDAAGTSATAMRLASMWASCGFPTVRCASKLGESFMATKVPSDCLPEISAPWPTLLLELPTNTLVAHDLTPANGWEDREYIHWLAVHNNPSADPHNTVADLNVTHANWVVWAITAAAGPNPPLKLRTLAEMASHAEDGLDVFPGDAFGRKRELDPDGRDVDIRPDAVASTMRMALRFVIGVMLELSSPTEQKRIGHFVKKGPPSHPRTSATPKSWRYKLTRDVRVNCREWVCGASERGERRMLSVQSLVRGHWKPLLSERMGRPIHVEPYWRGPEDAPIAVRPHVIGGAQ